MLIDFNDIFGESTWLYLQQTGIFFSLYGISETVKFFKQLRHVMQGRMMQNKRAKYLNNSVIYSVNLYLEML